MLISDLVSGKNLRTNENRKNKWRQQRCDLKLQLNALEFQGMNPSLEGRKEDQDQ